MRYPSIRPPPEPPPCRTTPSRRPPPLRPPNLSGARSDPALIRSWLALKPSPHTQRAYARAVQDFLAWSGPTSLAAVTVTLLQAWRAHPWTFCTGAFPRHGWRLLTTRRRISGSALHVQGRTGYPFGYGN